MGYLRLSDYGLIGNEASCALVSRLGSIDWCCLPHLDSPSHFAALLDDTRGGRFQIVPQGDFRSEQRYRQRTNVLETTFETAFGRGVITDWFPMDDHLRERPVLFRTVQVIEGRVNWALSLSPRFRYGTAPAVIERLGERLLFRGDQDGELAVLLSDVNCRVSSDRTTATARFSLDSGQCARFGWSWGRLSSPALPSSPEATVQHWRGVAHRCSPQGCRFIGPWHDLIVRAELTLRLLINRFSGAIAESVTSSLPAVEGSGMNWDLRFSWIREGALAMRALSELGSTREMDGWFSWVAGILERDGVEGLQPVYRLDGARRLPERELVDLAGYRGSRPVRMGNAAATQFKLDSYGHLMLAAHEYFHLHRKIPPGLWELLTDVADFICRAWRRPDQGPWEDRQRPEHYVASKVLCWAALDRALRLASASGRHASRRWEHEREILKRTILDNGFDEVEGGFVRAFGSQEIDASVLLIPWLGFLPYSDRRIQTTMDRVGSELSLGPFIRRSSRPDPGQSGPHLASSFLYVGCLARMGRVDEASERLTELCGCATPLGLLGEAVDAELGETTGNVPSALSLLGLIRAASEVSAARARRGREGLRTAGLDEMDEAGFG